jgi:hypothetical protein
MEAPRPAATLREFHADSWRSVRADLNALAQLHPQRIKLQLE